MQKVRRCVFDVNHLQEIEFLNMSGNTVDINSEKLNDRPGGLTFFRFICETNSVDMDPRICQKKTDFHFYLCFPQHQWNITTRVVENLSSARKRIKIPEKDKDSMAALLGGSPAIKNSTSADIFDAKTDAAHQH